jgi:hypothetical protein
MTIKAGQAYKHYKGHICKIIGIAIHSETEEELVIYSHFHNGVEQLWARPTKMFLENVDINGYKGPRFLLLE